MVKQNVGFLFQTGIQGRGELFDASSALACGRAARAPSEPVLTCQLHFHFA